MAGPETASKTRRLPPRSAILSTRSGEQVVLLDKAEESEEKSESGGGVIYTHEMPSLEEVLERYDVVSAVLERPLQVDDIPAGLFDESVKDVKSLGFGPILALGGLPAATFAAGVVMLVGALVGGSSVSNAYVALLFFFGGLGLGVTAWLTLREPASE